METESVRSARSEPAQRLHNHRHHRAHRHRGHSGRSAAASEQQRLRGPYETDPETDRDDRSVSTRASRVRHRLPPPADADDRGSQWGETTTVLTGATSEFNYSLEDVDESRDVENSVGFRCARYAGSVFAGVVGIAAFLSPIAMLVLPRVGIDGWRLNVCRPDCEGMLIAVGFKLLILAGGAWALFVRPPRATMPRLAVSRAAVLVLTFVVTFSFWLFYGVRIYKPDAADPAVQSYSHHDTAGESAVFNKNMHLCKEFILVAFSAQTLLVGDQKEHAACKKLGDEVLGCWHGYLSVARCRFGLQCFDAVGWRQEGHPACKKISGGGAGMVICLQRGADMHIAQLLPLPLTVSLLQ